MSEAAMSAPGEVRLAQMRAEVAERRAAHEPIVLPRLTETQARELAAGRVPEDVRETCRDAVEWDLK